MNSCLRPGRLPLLARLPLFCVLLCAALACSGQQKVTASDAAAGTQEPPTRPLPVVLQHLPADTWATVIVHDPGEFTDNLGWRAFLDARVDYERASVKVFQKLGANLFVQEGWVEAGLDPHRPAGFTLLNAEEGESWAVFATPKSKEQVKSSLLRMAQFNDLSPDVDVVGKALVLTFPQRDMAAVLRDDLLLFVFDRHNLSSLVQSLSTLQPEESLGAQPDVEVGIERAARGRDALLIGNLAVLATGPLSQRESEILFEQNTWWVAGVESTPYGLNADWTLPMEEDALLKELLLPRDRAGLAMKSSSTPLFAVDARLNPAALLDRLRAAGAPAAALSLFGNLAEVESGDISAVVGDDYRASLAAAAKEHGPVSQPVPVHAAMHFHNKDGSDAPEAGRLLGGLLGAEVASGAVEAGSAEVNRSDMDVAVATPEGSESQGSASPGSASPGSASPGSASPGSASPGSASPGSASSGSEPVARSDVESTPHTKLPAGAPSDPNHVDTEFFLGRFETQQDGSLVYLPDHAAPLSKENATDAWQHPHASTIAQALDSKGSVLTVAWNSALRSYARFEHPLSYITPPDYYLGYELPAPTPGEDREALEERLAQSEENTRLRKLIAIKREEMMALVRKNADRRVSLKLHQERPAALFTLRAEQDAIGWVGTARVIMNRPKVSDWMIALAEAEMLENSWIDYEEIEAIVAELESLQAELSALWEKEREALEATE